MANYGVSSRVELAVCSPGALSALGPVLCLHMATDPHPLAGWARARRLIAHVRIDSDGPSESLCFLDETDSCCWRLHLLPDSDFLAWDRLLAHLPIELDTVPCNPSRPSLRRAVPRWQCCPMRLHALPDAARLGLAASQPPLSALGEACARRLFRDACRRTDESCGSRAGIIQDLKPELGWP